MHTIEEAKKVKRELTYHIVHHPKGWCVRKGGSSRASFVFKTKRRANHKGLKLAKKHKCRLYIHNESARIEHRFDFTEKE